MAGIDAFGGSRCSRRRAPRRYSTFVVAVFACFAIVAEVPAAGACAHELPAFAPLGPAPAPADNPTTADKIELGKMLFFDTRLSGDASLSCASCHDPRQGWAFADEFSRGYPGTVNWRNSPTIVNAAYLRRLFWTGHAATLEAQAKAAGTGAIEMHGAAFLVEARLASIPEYRKRFTEVFGTERPTATDVWKAIASFERTITQADTPFDRFLRGEASALDPPQLRGFAVFRGKAGCASCHNGPLLTDERFHNTGVPRSTKWMTDTLARITFEFMQSELGERPSTFADDAGLYLYTKRKDDLGKFRTAPLRYTKYTAPYMHNGSMWTLREVVEFYNRGGDINVFPNTKSDSIVALGLNEQEIDDLVRFLEALSGEEIHIQRPALPSYPGQPVSLPIGR